MSNISIAQALAQSSQEIDRVDGQMLLQHVLQVSHAYLLTHPEHMLTPAQTEQYHHLVAQRENGVPIAYLIGQREFYGLLFQVNASVLIPRPETELLVDQVLARISPGKSYEILDLGTGSGAIAITLAKQCPGAHVTAVDVSADACAVAEKNARNLGVDNIAFAQGGWFEPLTDRLFDFIVSNPPYVAANDPHLEQGDLRFEPSMALIAGEEGLACLRTIVSDSVSHLKAGGWLLVEHGYDQAEACRKLLEQHGFSSILCCKDLAGVPRVSGGQLQ